MRIPAPAEACTGGESLPAIHRRSDHGESAARRGWTDPVLREILLATALLLPPAPVLRPFEAPITPYGIGHRGIDFVATPGDRVVAPMTGRITFVGRVHDRPIISITSGETIVSLEPVAGLLSVGIVVRAGDVIGVVDHGGHCSLRCLHIGMRVRGEYADPSLSGRRLLPVGRRGDVPHPPQR